MQKLLIQTIVYLLIFLAGQLAVAQDLISKDFPPGPARERMVQLAAAFNKLDTNVKLEAISFGGIVENTAGTAEEMLKTAAILGTDESTGKATVFDFGQIAKEMPRAKIDRFQESLQLNVSKGDLRIFVELRDVQKEKRFRSLNSMNPDGQMFSGAFFSTARLSGGFRTRVSRENTVCYKEILTTYLWGAPAETAEGCVRASCTDSTCSDCVVTNSKAFGGFFAEAEIVPFSGTPGRIVPPDRKNCCDGYFKWAWATGFKSIKVGTDKFSLEIEGHIGQSGNGSFTVTECCPRGTVAPDPNH